MSTSTTSTGQGQRRLMVIGVADLAVSADESIEMVTHALGSGMIVAAYDPLRRCGGLVRFLLPRAPGLAAEEEKPLAFAESGIPMLLAALQKLGADDDRLLIKLAGAAHFLKTTNAFNTGLQNLRATEEVLTAHGLDVAASATGGIASLNARFRIADGALTVVAPGANPLVL